MQLITDFLVGLRGPHRSRVGRDRFLPIADPGENVRRHVLRVRRIRRDLRIAQRRRQAFGGDARIVVQMDQIMRDAGMLRLALEDRLEDGRPLELVGVGLVGGRRRDIERDRVEDLGFVVIGIFRRQRLHRLQIGLHARLVRGLVVSRHTSPPAHRCSRARAGVLAPIAFALSIAARPSGRLGAGTGLCGLLSSDSAMPQ